MLSILKDEMIKTVLLPQELTVGRYTEEVVLEPGFEGWMVGPERWVVIEAGVRTRHVFSRLVLFAYMVSVSVILR